MQRRSINSRAIASIGYDAENEILEIEFRDTGDIYHYYDVELAVYEELLLSDSAGGYFNHYIRNLHEECRVH